MNISGKISQVVGLFYIDRDNMILTMFWNSLYLAFFLLPLGINLPTPLFIISGILGIVNCIRSRQKIGKDNRVLLLFPLYFLVMALGLFYTSNLQSGFALVQRSVALLIFPIVFLFVKEDASSVKRLFEFLLFGLLVSFFMNLAMGLYTMVNQIIDAQIFATSNHWSVILYTSLQRCKHYFITTDFSVLVNGNYVSVYVLLVVSYYVRKTLDTRIRFLIILVLFSYLFLLASWASCITIMIVSVLFISGINDRSKQHLLIFIALLGAIIFTQHPKIHSLIPNPDRTEVSAIQEVGVEQSRIRIWNTTFNIIKEAPFFGYGVGDANDRLLQEYKALGYTELYKNKYNAHNQFLQTWLQIGIPGIVILIGIFALLGYRMRRSPNEFAVFLILLISLLFESMLVRFNGIVFFSIIVSLLLKKRSILSSRIIRNISSVEEGK